MSNADIMGLGPFLKALGERLNRMTRIEAPTTVQPVGARREVKPVANCDRFALSLGLPMGCSLDLADCDINSIAS